MLYVFSSTWTRWWLYKDIYIYICYKYLEVHGLGGGCIRIYMLYVFRSTWTRWWLYQDIYVIIIEKYMN